MCDPAVFLETAGLFTLPTPMELFLPSQQPLPEIPKLPALRADVSAKGRARHLGFLLLSRRGVQNLSILPVSACSRICCKRQVSSIPLHLLFRPNPLRWASVEFLCRTSAQRPVLGLRWARARLCPENRTQPRHAAHAGGQAFFCCSCWNASRRFRMRSCSHSASSFASFCS